MITKEQKEESDRNLRIRKLENLINQWDKENEIDFCGSMVVIRLDMIWKIQKK